jgi:hypothetical protein
MPHSLSIRSRHRSGVPSKMDLQEGRKETIVSFGQVTSEALECLRNWQWLRGRWTATHGAAGEQCPMDPVLVGALSAGQRIAFVPLRRRRGGDRWGYDDATLGTHGADSSRASDLSIRLDVAPLAVHESQEPLLEPLSVLCLLSHASLEGPG